MIKLKKYLKKQFKLNNRRLIINKYIFNYKCTLITRENMVFSINAKN